jgi:PAS domain S-box-containing protein
MILDRENISRIKNSLNLRPKGLSITELARQLRMNRNSVAKYLEILLMSGEVEVKTYGTSKVYMISQRFPASAILGFSSNMILMVDNQRKILQVNNTFLEKTGMTRDVLIGLPVEESGIPFLTGLPLESALDESAEKKNVTLEKMVGSGGQDVFYFIKIIPTVFDSGDAGVTIIVEDISDRKRVEMALEKSERLYRSVLENIQDVFYRSDRNGNLIMASPSWASLLGYGSLDECTGKNIAEDFYIHPQERRKLLDTLGTVGSVTNYEVVLKCKDGSPRVVSTNSHLFYDESGAVMGVEGIFRDISERKAGEAKIHRYISQTEFLSQKVLEFINLPAGADIHQKIAGDMLSLIPDSMIAVNSYDHSAGSLTVKAVAGKDKRFLSIRFLRRNPEGLVIPVEATTLNSLRTGHLYRVPGTLFEITAGKLPRETCEQFSKAMNLGDIYAIGFVRGGRSFGNAVMFLPKGVGISDGVLVETYAWQASIALQKSQAEDALRQSQELFENVAELSPFPIAIIDTNGRYIYTNQGFTRLFGYKLDDFQTGREWFRLIFPDSEYRKRAISIWKEDLPDPESGIRPERTFTARCRDGSDKDVLFRSVRLHNGKLCVVFEDITERKHAEQVRKLLASIVESTGDAIIGKDLNGTVISWNSAAEHLYGFSRDEIIGRHISRIIPPERREEMDEIAKKIRMGTPVTSLETLRVRKDGTIIEVEVTISPITDDDGKVVGASTIARDIISQKAEERLRISEEKYRSLVNNINIGVYRSTGDPKGRFIWGNPSLVRILGYPSIDTLKKVNIEELFAEQDGRQKLLDELQRSGFVKDREILVRRADGKNIYLQVTALAKFAKDGTIQCINGLVENITPQRDAEGQLDTLRKEMTDIIDIFPDPAFVVDSANRVVAWNYAIEDLTGMNRKNVVGMGNFTHAIPFYGTPRPLLLDLVGSTESELEAMYPSAKREGHVLHAEVFAPALNQGLGTFLSKIAAPLTDLNGNMLGAIEIVREISGRNQGDVAASGDSDDSGGHIPFPESFFGDKPVKHGLTPPAPRISSLMYLATAVATAQDCILILDLSARCIWANEALVSLVGASGRTDLIGKSLAGYIAPEHRKIMLDNLSRIRKEKYQRFDLMFLSPQGRVQVETSISAIPDETSGLLGYMIIAHRSDSGHVKTKKKV